MRFNNQVNVQKAPWSKLQLQSACLSHRHTNRPHCFRQKSQKWPKTAAILRAVPKQQKHWGICQSSKVNQEQKQNIHGGEWLCLTCHLCASHYWEPEGSRSCCLQMTEQRCLTELFMKHRHNQNRISALSLLILGVNDPISLLNVFFSLLSINNCISKIILPFLAAASQ